jgi:hypothetical protein
MPWYAVYESADGRLVSVGSVLASRIQSGLEVREYAERPDQTASWDQSTREFVPREPGRFESQDERIRRIVKEVLAEPL